MSIPQSSREAFDILRRENCLDESLAESLKSMVEFRNIAVHNYQSLNLKIVGQVIEHHLNDLREFSKIMLQKF
ncbi:type VII toxin-antitoxin system HepT family RNase toxin [Desulfitobacterium sp. AusDCA]|uniref:type VII toxin-antitoxin system HepT family RNase toxin n=1 Tax=Desulfitobacterium sp. AusDCA TaxID=3240383 RepID=UPI003DA742CF